MRQEDRREIAQYELNA